MWQILLKITIFLILLIKLAHSKSLQLEEADSIESQEKALFKDIVKRNIPGEPMSNPYLKSTGLGLIKHDLIDKYVDAQSHLSECMPGSIFYNGTCIYFSSKRQKLSWIHAERFCRRLPLDTTFLTIKNDHEFEMIKKQIIKIAQKENPIDQLVFYIGFRFFENEWKWVNNQSLKNTNLTLGKYWWDWTGSHGDCGSLALLKTNELVMRSAPCLSTHGRFLCQYTLNPCYQNDVCGKYGRCVNLYHKFYCDCSPTIFYEGKYCERWNLALIQTIIGIVLIILLALVIWVNTSCFNSLWNKYCGKKIRRSRLREEQEYESDDPNDAHVKFSDPSDSKDSPGISTQKSRLYTSISVKINQIKKAIYINISNKTKQEWSAYLLLFILTSFFTAVQVSVIHGFARIERIDLAKNYTTITTMCNLLEENFLLEELMILIPALLFFVVLWFYHRQRRFNKYIMVKFKGYFRTSHYKRLQEEQKKIRKDQLKMKIEKLKSRGQCGRCRYYMYKSFKNSFCRMICCIFCCSCFVPPGSSNRCFICYCCYQGWRQTDLHKVFRGVKSFLYYFCLCFVWKRLYAVTKTHHKNAQNLKKHKKRPKKKQEAEAEEKNHYEDSIHDDDSPEIDMDQGVDIEDFNANQEFKRTSFPFPSMPFSTTNRSQSASVYVIYTYDVLSIFMYIYTANMSTVQLPFVGRPNGVLFDFTIQIIHVLLIGIKFYPILVVADMDPYAFVYLSASLYMGIIWTLKLFTKGFCSRTEAFVRRTLKKLSTDVGGQLSYKGSVLKNATKTVMGLFSEDPDPSQKYVEALKKGIPSVFKEYFGQYDKEDVANLLVTSNEDLVMNDDNTLGYSTANRYYLDDLIRATTSTATTTTISNGFRSSIKNRTRMAGSGFMEIISERNASSEMIINILENLPLYLTLSFLFARYIVLFFGQITDLLVTQIKACSPRAEDNAENFFDEYIRGIDLGLSDETVSRIQQDVDTYLDNLSDVKHENSLTSEIKDRQNHNYNYIQNLISKIKFFKCASRGRERRTKLAKQVAEKVSWMWWFFETYIYKNVPFMKYSKQFVNTYTVAFMVVYFFTLFGFRLSNLFGNTLVVTIELIYRFIFRGMIPTFNFEEHNFNAEFRMTCLFTSLVITIQLFLSIRHFHYDLMKLHKGEKLIHRLAEKYREIDNIAKERRSQSSTITSDSLHFPGYMIAHLVYGYVLLFMVFFCCTILIKLLFYFPKVLQTSSQIIIPLLILVALKFVVIQLATRIIFLREDGQRITNLTPYYTITYFNFFFDCFLGLVACMSRIWQTTIVSLLTLPRIDKSMFNRDSDIIMRRLDKGHLAYINYVRMEHWYNNAVVNGFCEMLIESMLYSQIYKFKFDIQARHAITVIQDPYDDSKGKIRFQKFPAPVDRQPMRVKSQSNALPLKSNLRTLSPPKYYNQLTSVTESSIPWKHHPRADSSLMKKNISSEGNHYTSEIKRSNPDFDYKSFLRLRNLFFLCLMLKSNPILCRFRHHYLVQKGKEERILEGILKVGTFSESLNKKLGKILIKAKETFKGSTSRISRLNVNNSSFFNSTDLAENDSEQSSLDFKFERHVETVEVIDLNIDKQSSEIARKRQRRGSI